MSHRVVEFSFRDLADIDGNRLQVAFDQALKRCADDCYDRPGVSKPRKINMACELVPILDADGVCEEVKCSFEFSDTAPKRSSKVYSLNLKPDGKLLYHPEVLENHAQMALDLAEQDDERERRD